MHQILLGVEGLVEHRDLDFKALSLQQKATLDLLSRAFVFLKHLTAPPKEKQRQPPLLQQALKMKAVK